MRHSVPFKNVKDGATKKMAERAEKAKNSGNVFAGDSLTTKRDSNHFSGSAVANGGHTVKSPVFKRDEGSAPSTKSVSATSSTNKGNTHSSNSV